MHHSGRLGLCALVAACGGSTEQHAPPAARATATPPDTVALADSLRRLVPLGLGMEAAQERLTRAGFRCGRIGFGTPQGLACSQPLPAAPPAAPQVWRVLIDQGGWS